MRGAFSALMVLVLAVVGPLAAIALVMVPRITDPEVVVPAVRRSGADLALRRWAAEVVVTAVRERTGSPIERTPGMEALMAEIIDDQWLDEAARAMVASIEAGRPVPVDLAPLEARLAARWPEVSRIMVASLPICGRDESPLDGVSLRCQPLDDVERQLVVTGLVEVVGPGSVLEAVPDRVELRSAWTERAHRAVVAGRRQRVRLAALSGAALLLLVLVAPRRLMWLGRGLLAPALILVGVGVLLLAGAALFDTGAVAAVFEVLAAAYGPLLVGSAVLLVMASGLAFAG